MPLSRNTSRRIFPGFTVDNAQALFTPEAFYPLTGIKDLYPSVSVSEGVQILDAAIKQQLGARKQRCRSGLLAELHHCFAGDASAQSHRYAECTPVGLHAARESDESQRWSAGAFPGSVDAQSGLSRSTGPRRAIASRRTSTRSNTTASPTSRSTRSISSPTSTPSRASTTCTGPMRISRPRRSLRPFR